MGQATGMGGMMPFAMASMVIVLLALLLGAVFLVLYLRRPVTTDDASIRGAAVKRLPMPTSGPAEGEREAFLVIPDISGYTRFLSLNRFALAHAQYAISELLKSMIAAGGDELWAAKVEGDAILLCAWRNEPGIRNGLNGDQVARRIAAILAAFYRRRDELRHANLCTCSACSHIDQLDLKVIVHSGTVLSYDLGGRGELSGVPVIVAHRLLKNTLGLTRYVLVTDAAHQEVKPALQCEPSRHPQLCEDIGEVTVYVYAFEPGGLLLGGAAAADLGARADDTLRKLRSNLQALGPAERRQIERSPDH
jgi:class 3 adenylate cyclase